MTDETPVYLIWSNEHGAWWRAAGQGYSARLVEAGLFSRARALAICTDAVPGTAAQMGMLPELPVRLADILAIAQRFEQQFPTVIQSWL